jgi:hypothetical protein
VRVHVTLIATGFDEEVDEQLLSDKVPRALHLQRPPHGGKLPTGSAGSPFDRWQS